MTTRKARAKKLPAKKKTRKVEARTAPLKGQSEHGLSLRLVGWLIGTL
jgi:hypothetical protein